MLFTPGDYIKKTFTVYRENMASILRYIGVFFGLSFLMLVLAWAGVVFLMGTARSNFEGHQPLAASITPSMVAVIVLFGIIFLLAFIWWAIAMLRTCSRASLGQPKLGLGQELKNSRPLIGRMIGLMIVNGLITIGPFLVGMIAWSVLAMVRISLGTSPHGLQLLISLVCLYGIFHLIYFSNRLGFSSMRLALENDSVMNAVKESGKIVQGRWWGIFGRRLAIGVVLIVPYYVFGILTTLGGMGGIFFALCMFVYYIFALLPIAVLSPVVLYHNAKEFPHPKNK